MCLWLRRPCQPGPGPQAPNTGQSANMASSHQVAVPALVTASASARPTEFDPMRNRLRRIEYPVHQGHPLSTMGQSEAMDAAALSRLVATYIDPIRGYISRLSGFRDVFGTAEGALGTTDNWDHPAKLDVTVTGLMVDTLFLPGDKLVFPESPAVLAARDQDPNFKAFRKMLTLAAERNTIADFLLGWERMGDGLTCMTAALLALIREKSSNYDKVRRGERCAVCTRINLECYRMMGAQPSPGKLVYIVFPAEGVPHEGGASIAPAIERFVDDFAGERP